MLSSVSARGNGFELVTNNVPTAEVKKVDNVFNHKSKTWKKFKAFLISAIDKYCGLFFMIKNMFFLNIYRNIAIYK